MRKQPPRALVDYVQPNLDSLASNKKLISNPKVNILLLQRHLRGKSACYVHIWWEKYRGDDLFGLDLLHLLFPINSKAKEVLVCAAREELPLVLHTRIYHPGGPGFW